MTESTLLETRATVQLAAMIVTWVAIVLITLIAANLHTRLLRLERAAQRPNADPFDRLAGAVLADVLPAAPEAVRARALVLLSAGCAACERLLRELRAAPPPAPIALFWSDGPPAALEPLPENVHIGRDGTMLRERLGIGVTPFALLIGEDGLVLKGFPLTTLEPLRRALNGSEQPPSLARVAAH